MNSRLRCDLEPGAVWLLETRERATPQSSSMPSMVAASHTASRKERDHLEPHASSRPRCDVVPGAMWLLEIRAMVMLVSRHQGRAPDTNSAVSMLTASLNPAAVRGATSDLEACGCWRSGP